MRLSQRFSVSRIEYKWRVLATVIFGLFMVILDTTAVNVAFQTLREEFGVGLSEAQWIISVYVLALGVSTPLAGFLADRFGIKRVYLTGLSVFVIGSLLCGIAPNLWWLVAARTLQGFGGGIAIPLGTALLFAAFPPNEQGFALGIFGIAALVAPTLGPILGGWLVDQNLWRLIFFINPPIGLVGVLLGSQFLVEHKSEKKPQMDVLGLVTEVIGFGAVLYAASVAATQGWSSPTVLEGFVVGGIGLVLFAFVELFVARQPLLNLRLYKERVFLNANLLGYVSVLALFGAEFLLPVYLQSLRGRSAFETGLILLPMAISGGIMTPIAGRWYDKVGPRVLTGAGFAILMVNTWQFSLLQADTPINWILVLLALRGIALGLTVQTTLVAALSVVQRRELAIASSLTNATRQVVQSIGVAVLATVLASTLSPQTLALSQLQVPPRSGMVTSFSLCEPQQSAFSNPGYTIDGSPIPAVSPALLQQACLENVAGFERAYRLTFYAAFVALGLGLLLPGWPGRWEGRQSMPDIPAGH